MTLEEATRLIPCGKYCHYKGGLYEVIGTAVHSEDKSVLVVYRALYGEKNLWVRPASMWNENVEVDGEMLPRFWFIG